MKGRVVDNRPAGCGHAWVLVFEQGVTLVIECEFCGAAVAIQVSRHEHDGYAFSFYALCGTVSNDDFRAVGDWLARKLGTPHTVHLDGRAARRRRRCTPVRAA